ncbi:DUF4352 domain-containing protein [Streptomyces sp. NPDC006540]|uniref:DUF4352 domain-containing protein n=1 Tax=Streptomyces sp. NPDC006540 TaxID=3155353 RepID=UPI0033B763FC
MSGGAIVAIVLGSVFGGLFLLLGLGAAISDSSTSTKKPVTSEAAKKQPAPGDAKPAEKQAAEPEPPSLVQVTAKRTTFKPGVFHGGGEFTSVLVTVVNNSDEKIRVSPLYFAITDITGTKHSAEYGEDKNQIGSMDLAPGEKATGVVTGKGVFTPKYVTYTDGLFGRDVRGNVS